MAKKKAAPNKKRAVGRSVVDERPTRRGVQMRKGSGWLLISPNKLEFLATLLETIDVDGNRVAIFSVPQRLLRS